MKNISIITGILAISFAGVLGAEEPTFYLKNKSKRDIIRVDFFDKGLNPIGHMTRYGIKPGGNLMLRRTEMPNNLANIGYMGIVYCDTDNTANNIGCPSQQEDAQATLRVTFKDLKADNKIYLKFKADRNGVFSVVPQEGKRKSLLDKEKFTEDEGWSLENNITTNAQIKNTSGISLRQSKKLRQ